MGIYLEEHPKPRNKSDISWVFTCDSSYVELSRVEPFSSLFPTSALKDKLVSRC